MEMWLKIYNFVKLFFLHKNRFMRKLSYISPELSELNFAVEAGFGLSDENPFAGLPGETPESNDYGEF